MKERTSVVARDCHGHDCEVAQLARMVTYLYEDEPAVGRLAEEQLRAGAQWADNGLVFASPKGTPMDAQNIVKRYFKALLRSARLDIRWHDLRHTCAILLLSRGTRNRL